MLCPHERIKESVPQFALYRMNPRQEGEGLLHTRRPDLIHLPGALIKLQISACSTGIDSLWEEKVAGV